MAVFSSSVILESDNRDNPLVTYFSPPCISSPLPGWGVAPIDFWSKGHKIQCSTLVNEVSTLSSSWLLSGENPDPLFFKRFSREAIQTNFS